VIQIPITRTQRSKKEAPTVPTIATEEKPVSRPKRSKNETPVDEEAIQVLIY